MPRKLCDQCARPVQVCLCSDFVSIEAPLEVVILQHPSEQKQALATVPLIKQCLSPANILVGEDFSSQPMIDALLSEPDSVRVIYPADNAEPWQINSAISSAPKIKTLIVIDGTWRKAKRIWHMNPWLTNFKAVVLEGMNASAYRIRSSSVEGGVSTIEAVVGALNYLTASQDYDALLKPFKAMIGQQIEKMGSDVFAAHYGREDLD